MCNVVQSWDVVIFIVSCGRLTVFCIYCPQMNMASKHSFLHVAIFLGIMCAYCSEVSAVIHIAPNVASCGEVENCTSLAEYSPLSNVNRIDVVFLPGKHVLNRTICFREVSDVTLMGSCSSNETCLIFCSSNFSGLRFEDVIRPVITNLRFANCEVDITSYSYGAIVSIFSQITNCSFSSTKGRVLLVRNSIVSVKACSFTDITTTVGFAVEILSSVAHFNGNNTFTNNTVSSSVLELSYSNATFSDDALFYNNSGSQGGSLSVSYSNVTFNGTVVFRLSYSRLAAGALLSYNSRIFFYGETLFEESSADYVGALTGVISSKFNVFGNLTFYNNTATWFGGGLGLADSSQIYLAQGSRVVFKLNHAEFLGGAIYAEDTSSCFTPGPCNFQVMDIDDPHTDLIFINNSANVAGDDIYDEDIDWCMINNEHRSYLGGDIFDNIFTIHHDKPSISSIASVAIQVCQCVNDTPMCLPNDEGCGIMYPESCTMKRTIYPGEVIQVTVAAVGHRGEVVPGRIRALNSNNDLFLVDLVSLDSELIQGINATCTNLSYTVTSTSQSEILYLYPKPSICRATDIPLSIFIKYTQPCPYGFHADNSTGACVCEERLMSIGDITCNITHKTFEHHGEHWIGFDKSSKGLIIHNGRCPFDYCITNQEVTFTLNDTQKECSFNRSGHLCGECQDGLSIKLGGTSKCDFCSNAYLALLIPFAIAGVALVVLLFVCELNVVAGTLSGLIFYANVVQINRTLFFKSNNVLTIFIAWLNLDLGIETCFYDGMDTYGKTWLQFLFPFYIWVIVGLIILLSSYSKRITKVLGSHPIAVLATLFLLSYEKILRVFISVVSFTTLDYPNRTAIVWQSDANVEYLQGKHIPLFLAAVLIFLPLFIPYTVLLLFGQWIQTKAHWRFMGWAKSQRLKAFLDVYHAPYKDKHRYWPGLLLLFRIALAIVNATAAKSLSPVTYAVIVTVLLVHLWGWTARGVYKKWPLDTLEAVFFVNLGLLVFATYYIDRSGGNQMAAINTSVSVTLLVFVGILLYHILVLRLKLDKVSAKDWMMKISEMLNRNKAQMETTASPLDVSTNTSPETVSYISLRELLLEEDPK